MIIKQVNKHGIDTYHDDVLNASKVKSPPERIEQKNLNNHSKKQFPCQYDSMFHVVNESGGKGSQFYGAKLNDMGRKSGVSDWFVLAPSRGYHGLIIELKRSRKRDSSIDAEQVKFLKRQQELGYYVCVCYGYLAAMHVQHWYLLTSKVD